MIETLSTTTSPPPGRRKALVADRDHDELLRCAQALGSTGLLDIAADTTTYSLLSSLVARHKPEFLFIAIDNDTISYIEKLRAADPSLKIVALGDLHQSELVLRSFRSGADEFIGKPLQTEEVQTVLNRLQQRKTVVAAEPVRQGKVLAFLGSRGGCGTTMVACNTAVTLQQTHSTILVDLNYGQGDMALHLNLPHAFSLADLSEAGDRYDDTLLESITTRHGSGLHLLLQPSDGRAFAFDAESIKRLIQRLQGTYDFVLLDLGCRVDRAAAFSPLLYRLFLIAGQDLPSVFLSSQKIQRLMQEGFDTGLINVIVNNYAYSRAVTLGRIAKAINKKNLVTIRSDEKRVLSAINQGVPLREINRRGRAVKDLTRFVQAFLKQEPMPTVQPDEKKKEAFVLDNSMLPQITVAN